MSSDARRSAILYALPLSLLVSGEALAADPEPSVSSQLSTSKNSAARKTAKPARPAAESVEVRGRRVSTIASSATKTDTPLIETAQSVTVITRNEMDIRGVLNLNQAIRYTAGITSDLRGGGVGTRYDQFQLRGFTVPTFLDGLKLQPSTGYASAQTDTSRLERVEVLKGPSSALYGQSSPGGLVALSSKTPLDKKFYGDIATTGGSFDLYRVDADVGGYATKDGFVRYRIYGTANGQHSQLSKTGSRRFSISPAFTFGGDGPTTLTLLGNYQYDPENGTYGGAPLLGTLIKAPFGYLPRKFYDGDASFEKFNRRQGAITYIFNHQFNKDWSFSTRGRYDDIKAQYRSVYDNGYYTDPTTLARSSISTNEHTHNLAFDSAFKGKVRTGPLTHSMMFGFDYMQQSASEVGLYGTADSMDVLHPNYYNSNPVLYPWINYQTDSHQVGVYGQDEIRWKGLVLTGSLRNDWYRSNQLDRATNETTKEAPSQITWRASGLYHFNFGLAPYISYSTSFEPQSGLVSKDGGANTKQADPSVGKQLEGGLKYQIPGTSVLFTVAGFHIEQTNVLVPVTGQLYNTQSGKVHSDGFEFEAHAEPYKNLDITASISIQKIKDSSTGKPLQQSGKGNAALFAFYTLPKGPMKGFGFGGGMRYTAKSYAGESTYGQGSVWVPQYAVFDGSLRYDLSQLSPSLHGWSLAASVRNLFDKKYIGSCMSYSSYNQAWCYYGERRNAQGTIAFSW